MFCFNRSNGITLVCALLSEVLHAHLKVVAHNKRFHIVKGLFVVERLSLPIKLDLVASISVCNS